jgi:hypothetical protein
VRRFASTGLIAFLCALILAPAIAPALHAHGHHAPRDRSGLVDRPQHAQAAGHAACAAKRSVPAAPSPDDRHHDDDCPLCAIAAARFVGVEPGTVVRTSDVRVVVATSPRLTPAAHALPSPPIRGPPRIAAT